MYDFNQMCCPKEEDKAREEFNGIIIRGDVGSSNISSVVRKVECHPCDIPGWSWRWAVGGGQWRPARGSPGVRRMRMS